jgi:hypothetical protein
VGFLHDVEFSLGTHSHISGEELKVVNECCCLCWKSLGCLRSAVRMRWMGSEVWHS